MRSVHFRPTDMSATLPTLSKAKRLPVRGATNEANVASKLAGRGLHRMITARRPPKPFGKADEIAGMGAARAQQGSARPQEETGRYHMKIVITLDLTQVATALAILLSVQ